MRRIDPADLPSHTRALLLDADGQPVYDDPLPARTHQFAMTAPRNSNGVMLNALIDAEVQRILQEGQEIARALLLKHSKQLALLADTLMEREQLDRAQFETLLQEE
jgi:ATP-dependent Zn protease